MILEDIPFMLEVRNHESTYKQLHTPIKFSIDQATVWFLTANPQWYILENLGNKVGYIRTSNWDFNNKSMTIGCDIHPNYRRQGLARKGYDTFIDLLKTKGWNELNLLVLKTNTIAFHLYKSLKFEIYDEDLKSFYMRRFIAANLNTKKGLKVVCCYFGTRRSTPRDAKSCLNLLKFIWNTEQTLEQGYDYDTCFIVNNVTLENSSENKKDIDACLDFLKNINGKKTANGVAFVEHRQNIGLSFGAFDAIFNKYKKNYDYWMFTEDDQVIIKDQVFHKCLTQLENPLDLNNVGFIATVGVNRDWGPAAHGGCGVTSREILYKVLETNYNNNLQRNSLYFNNAIRLGPHMTEDDLWGGEVMFTRSIHNLGYYLEDVDMTNLIVSWQNYNKRNDRVIEFETWMENLEQDKQSFPEINFSKLYGIWKIDTNLISICKNNCGFNRSLLDPHLGPGPRFWGNLHFLNNKICIIWDTDDMYYLQIDPRDLTNLNSAINIESVSKEGKTKPLIMRKQ